MRLSDSFVQYQQLKRSRRLLAVAVLSCFLVAVILAIRGLFNSDTPLFLTAPVQNINSALVAHTAGVWAALPRFDPHAPLSGGSILFYVFVLFALALWSRSDAIRKQLAEHEEVQAAIRRERLKGGYRDP